MVNNIGGEISVYENMNTSKFVYTRSSNGLKTFSPPFQGDVKKILTSGQSCLEEIY